MRAPARVSVVLSTYNQPRWLEKALWGYAAQRFTGFEVLVADDGSGPETADVVSRLRETTDLRLVHVWHEDRGFRKTEILNRAVLAASGDYLIFSDGDCIPHPDFVATHVGLARERCFLSGGYIKLPMAVSQQITEDDVRSCRAFDAAWLRAQGWRGRRRAIRLPRSAAVATLLDALTPTRATWNGHNASTWRAAIVAVNGFDLDMGYGGEDRALGERLVNLGLRGRRVRFRASCLHLDHPRPYADPEVIRANRRIRDDIRRTGDARTRRGLAEVARESEGEAPGRAGAQVPLSPAL
ncbi:MAG: glycosyltransferase family 2 protein [Gemmatimonadaceae bacterium]